MERNRSTVFCHSLSYHIWAFFRLADNDHFLLLKLMDPVNTALLDAVGTFLLTEAWRIAGQCLRQLSSSGVMVSINLPIMECSLVPIRYRSSPSILYIMASISAKLITPVTTLLRIMKRRYTIGKAAVDHEISCIGDHCGMQSCDITHQVVESRFRLPSCCVQINAVEALHDICMVRDLEIRYYRLTESLDLYVLAVILYRSVRWDR